MQMLHDIIMKGKYYTTLKRAAEERDAERQEIFEMMIDESTEHLVQICTNYMCKCE